MSGSDKVQTVKKHTDQTEVRHSLTSLLAQAIQMHIHTVENSHSNHS